MCVFLNNTVVQTNWITVCLNYMCMSSPTPTWSWGLYHEASSAYPGLLPAYPAQPIHNNGNEDQRYHEAGCQLVNSTQVWLIMNLWTRTYKGAGSRQQTNRTHERRRKDAVLLLWGAEMNSERIRGWKTKSYRKIKHGGSIQETPNGVATDCWLHKCVSYTSVSVYI